MSRALGPEMVLVYGQPLTLKSTLALDLAWHLNAGLVSTGFFGLTTPEDSPQVFMRSRRKRYDACAQLAREYVVRGWRVVVEGNFQSAEWRKDIVSIAMDCGSPLTVIRCVCRNRQELLRRQRERSCDAFGLDKNVNPYGRGRSVAAATRCTSAEVRRVNDFGAIVVDTGAWSARIERQSRGTAALQRTLESWIQRVHGDPDRAL